VSSRPALEHLHSTVDRIEKASAKVLRELHPELLKRVNAAMAQLDGRFVAYCGFRGESEQKLARMAGHSDAKWLESPHNYRPALACDVVLNPRMVRVRPHPSDPAYPDLWDTVSPEAVRAWADLDRAAAMHVLERVTFRSGKKDLPHLQLPAWRKWLPKPS
jgi:hypothetical protein